MTTYFYTQEAFEKCWAHSLLRAASRLFTRCRQRYCRALPAHRCPRRQRQRRQRERVTEGTAMAPWNGPNNWPYGTPCVLLFIRRREDSITIETIKVLYRGRANDKVQVILIGYI